MGTSSRRVRRSVAVGSCVFLLCAPAARAADFSGAWLIEDALGARKSSVVCVLKADASGLYGPCAAVGERSRPAAGHLDGGSMTFRYHTDYNGSGVHLAYRGDAQPDGSFKGSVTSEGGKGVFQAQPLTDTKSGAPVTWKVSAAFSDTLRYVLLCTFKADGQHISGPCTAITGPALNAQGTGNGNTIALHYGVPGGLSEYAGALQPDGTLAGTIREGGSSGRFAAERQ